MEQEATTRQHVAELMAAIASRLAASLQRVPNGNTRDAISIVARAIQDEVEVWGNAGAIKGKMDASD